MRFFSTSGGLVAGNPPLSTMKTETRKIAELIEDPANVRLHGGRNLEAIKGSLARFGQQKPIVVTPKNVVVAGNGTLAAARSLSWTELDVVVTELEGTDLTAFGIADNRTAELAEWDFEGLGKVLGEMEKAKQGAGAELGWAAHELVNILAADWNPGEHKGEELPEDEGGEQEQQQGEPPIPDGSERVVLSEDEVALFDAVALRFFPDETLPLRDVIVRAGKMALDHGNA